MIVKGSTVTGTVCCVTRFTVSTGRLIRVIINGSVRSPAFAYIFMQSIKITAAIENYIACTTGP